MNKTININLGGFAFQIEEDAFEMLDTYLTKIRNNLGISSETDEIINDIEARIAELFRTEIRSGTEVITIEAVKEIIRLVGEPEEFILDDEKDETDAGSTPGMDTSAHAHSGKSIFRDINRKVFSGVCSGIALYLNIDPVIIRILFAVIFYFWHPFILIYVLLWIAMPAPKTPAQWFEMKGGQDYFKAKSGSSGKSGDNFRSSSPGASPFNYRGNDMMAKGVRNSGNVLGIIIGLVFAVVSFLGLVSLVVFTLFQNSSLGEMLPHNIIVYEFPHRMLESNNIWLMSLAFVLIAGIPLLLLFYAGLKLIFNFKTNGLVLGLTALVLWLAGIGIMFYGVLSTVTDFKTYSNVKVETMLQPVTSDTLYINPFNNARELRYDEYLMDMNRMDLYITEEGELIIEGNPKINLYRGDELKIVEQKSARGKTEGKAIENAKGIEYSWAQKDSVLYLDKIFTLEDKAMLRDQKITINIYVPDSIPVKIDQDIDYLINDETDSGSFSDDEENENVKTAYAGNDIFRDVKYNLLKYNL